VKLATKVCQRLDVPFNAVFTLSSKGEVKKPLPLPTRCSVKDALVWYCDYQSLIRHSLLKTLSQYFQDEEEKKKILFWASPQGKEEFNAEQLSLVDIIDRFPSFKPPFDHFLDWVPKIQPRFYTISSSSKVHPTNIHITVSLAITEKKDGRKFYGLCTSYLLNKEANKDNVCVFVRQSSFRLPRQTGTPLIMVGPGTGIAPFRAFLQEAIFLKNKNDGKALGPITLFFGCRNRKKDFIYREELEEAETQKVCQKLLIAFSREEKKKVYVQDLMKENADYLWDLLQNKRASMYVCGGAAMGKSVRELIRRILETNGKMTADQSETYVKKLGSEGRYIAELWS